MVRLRNILLLICLTAVGGLTAERSYSASGLTGEAALIPFRGAWIATVANIDWPTPEAVGNDSLQQAEMTWLLDSLESLGINAIIFQVRPTADALYISQYEPSSHWLTGTQGDSLTWDPLEWTIEQAHARHMEVHVWLNPYRVNLHKTDTSILAQDHIFRQHPEWFWCYAKQWYFDPGLDVTREWICTIVQDIVNRYDIQAIHMDDYFYPYPVGGKPLPDTKTFAAHPRGITDINDWRRNNVNMAIREISATIHECRDSVQFGISPFGVWRNASVDSTGSATTAGITNYDDLYADIRLWIREGWIDYVLPQLYWEIGKKAADYEVLAHWWANEIKRANELNPSNNVKLYIGMAPYRLEGAKRDTPWGQGNEIGRQMRLNRTIPEITGECFYSTRPLLRNPRHVCDTIKAIYIQEPKNSEYFLPWE
jgi:uncharacterized lipoprotein YddW (UPF0748 family)